MVHAPQCHSLTGPYIVCPTCSYTDIKRKEGQSVFIRPHEGLFGLREWIEQGVAFQVGHDRRSHFCAKLGYAVNGPFR